MKDKHQARRSGLWLDYHDAFLVILDKESDKAEPDIHHFVSGVHHAASKGGWRSKTPYGPQGHSDERKILERRLHDEHAYFEKLLTQISPMVDELIIMGPGQAKKGLMAWMASHRPGVRVLAEFTCDYLTVPQIEAAVRDFYRHPHQPHPIHPA